MPGSDFSEEGRLPGNIDMTAEEANAIAALRRVASRWPRSLMLISMEGSLHVVRNDESRFDPSDGTAIDPDAVIADIEGIPNTGGSW